MNCWLCNRPVEDPPDVIGRWHATSPRVAHRHCLRILGEYELDLEISRADESGDPGPHPRTVPGRHG